MNIGPGDKVTIRINGVEIETEIDQAGVQRMPRLLELDALVDTGLLDFNKLAMAVATGKVSMDVRRWVYQRIGFSVCGYADSFPEDEINNPLWEK